MGNVNNIILEWAREQAGLPVKDAARLLNINDTKTATAEDKLLSYENGTKSPSQSLINRMSKLYKRPILTFYLNEPPLKTEKGEDFRTLPEALDPQQNFYVETLLRDIKARQSIIRQTLIDEVEAEPLPYIGGYTSKEGIQGIARALTATFEIDLNDYRRQRDYASAFKYLRQKIEDKGVFILLKGNLGSYHTDIELAIFRGFALCDDIAPMIVINHQEAKAARAFTLLHEVAHLLLGQTGVSSSIVEKHVEVFCDRVASEILLPAEEFKGFDTHGLNLQELKEAISFYAQDRRISASQVAFRCLQAQKIDQNTWTQLRDHFYRQWQEARQRDRERNSPVSLNVVRRSYLGELVNFVKRMNLSGALSTTKAGVVLGVKPLKVHGLLDNNTQAT